MKKKLLLPLLGVIAVFGSFGFSACGNDKTPSDESSIEDPVTDGEPSSDETPTVVYTVTDEVKQSVMTTMLSVKRYELSMVQTEWREGDEDVTEAYSLHILSNEKAMKRITTFSSQSETEYFSFDGGAWEYEYHQEYDAFTKEESQETTDPREIYLSPLSAGKYVLEYATFDDTKNCYTMTSVVDSSGIEIYVYEFYFENDALVKYYYSVESSWGTGSGKATCTYNFKDVPDVTLPETHEHTVTTNWEKDGAYHWQTTTCTNHAAEEANKKPHQYDGTTCSVCGYEAQATEGLTYRLAQDESYYIVTGLEDGFAEDTLVIPSAYNSLPVMSIDASAFYGKAFKSVIIPDSILYIGQSAFEACGQLESVRIGNGVETIDYYAFQDCDALKTVVIGSGIKQIEYRAFNDSYSITEVYLYAAVPPELDNQTWDCYGCTLYVPLNSYDLYDSLALWGEFSKKSVLPEEQRVIDGVQYNADNTGIISVDTSKEGALVIPDGVTKIYSNAIQKCWNITSVTIPASVNTIGKSAFSGLGSDTKIYYNGTVNQWAKINFERYDANPLSRTALLYINGAQMENITLSHIGGISAYAFYGCSTLTSVTIGEGVTSIGNNAFSRCNGVIQTENGVSYVDNWVIDCDTSVTSVALRANTKGFAPYAFRGCNLLTSITVPSSVIFIGERAFVDCSSLAGVTFENTSGWLVNAVSLSASDLANAATAAAYLKGAYQYYNWTRI